jgi:RHS repeat-associated protein
VHGPGADEPLVAYVGSAAGPSNRSWLVADQQGSIVAMTDGSGASANPLTYDEYGIPGATNNPPGSINRFQYTGQAWIPEIGLYDFKARIYSQMLGRFLQSDPIGYGDGLNMYAYVHGGLVNGRDPSGTIPLLRR